MSPGRTTVIQAPPYAQYYPHVQHTSHHDPHPSYHPYHPSLQPQRTHRHEGLALASLLQSGMHQHEEEDSGHGDDNTDCDNDNNDNNVGYDNGYDEQKAGMHGGVGVGSMWRWDASGGAPAGPAVAVPRAASDPAGTAGDPAPTLALPPRPHTYERYPQVPTTANTRIAGVAPAAGGVGHPWAHGASPPRPLVLLHHAASVPAHAEDMSCPDGHDTLAGAELILGDSITSYYTQNTHTTDTHGVPTHNAPTHRRAPSPGSGLGRQSPSTRRAHHAGMVGGVVVTALCRFRACQVAGAAAAQQRRTRLPLTLQATHTHILTATHHTLQAACAAAAAAAEAAVPAAPAGCRSRWQLRLQLTRLAVMTTLARLVALARVRWDQGVLHQWAVQVVALSYSSSSSSAQPVQLGALSWPHRQWLAVVVVVAGRVRVLCLA